MIEEEIGTYRRRLLALKERLGARLSELEEVPRPDGAASEYEFAITLVGSKAQLLTEVTDALARVEQGTFGCCEGCGRQVFRARLGLFPYARHCFCCASSAVGGRNVIRPIGGTC